MPTQKQQNTHKKRSKLFKYLKHLSQSQWQKNRSHCIVTNRIASRGEGVKLCMLALLNYKLSIPVI